MNPHPISSLISELTSIFEGIGYSVSLGNELETEYYNFDALNIAEDHPAREMWDTFWIKGQEGKLLRTHTSPMQIRHLEKNKPPISVIVPGKVFRNEATDSTHEAQFYQLEGLKLGEDVTLKDLKGTIDYALKQIFEDSVQIKYVPSFFPFTEPSMEVYIKREEDNDWLEIAGCGMVHPLVLSRTGVDPVKYRGFAFGFGLDRIAAIKYGIDDIRLMYKGDLRFINQF